VLYKRTLIEIIILVLIPALDYRNKSKLTNKVVLSEDLYSELPNVSTPNQQKHWHFKVFY